MNIVDRLVDAYMRFRLRHPWFLDPADAAAFRYYTTPSERKDRPADA